MTATLARTPGETPCPVIPLYPDSGDDARLMAYALYACPSLTTERLRRLPAVRRTAKAAQAARGA